MAIDLSDSYARSPRSLIGLTNDSFADTSNTRFSGVARSTR